MVTWECTQMNIFKDKINWNTTAYRGQYADRINNVLTINLRIICRRIINIIPKVVSIYLTDSFACGEASVRMENNEFKFISDIDLLVVSKAPKFLLKIKSKHLEEILPEGLYNIEITNRQVVDIKLMNESELKKLPPSLTKYELRTAKCIYGYNLLNQQLLKMDASEIPLTDGFRRLFDRMFGALIPFSADFIHFEPNDKQKRYLMFGAAKLVSACRDILLISNKVYFPTKEERQHYLRYNWPTKFRQLAQELPFFLQLSEKCHQYLLRPNRAAEEEALNVWFDAVQACSKILTILNFTRENYPISYKLYSYLNPFGKKSIRWKHKILEALILLFFSIRYKEIDENLLENVQKVLGIHSYFKKYRKKKEEVWEIIKAIVIKSYSSLPPSRITFYSFFHNLIANLVLIISRT